MTPRCLLAIMKESKGQGVILQMLQFTEARALLFPGNTRSVVLHSSYALSVTVTDNSIPGLS